MIKLRKNIIYKIIRFFLVLYAVGMLDTLGLYRSSWPAFVGMVLFTGIFLKYTNDIDKNTYESYQNKYTIIFTIIFVIILLLGICWRICWRFGTTILMIELLISIPGMFILIYRSCLLAGIGWTFKSKLKTNTMVKNRWAFIWPFIFIWIACFLIFLNMYPGTLSCDTPEQLKEALGLSEFSNLNPLINTLIVTVCVRIGMAIGTVNTGIAIYTFVQFTMYAGITAYTVYILHSKGFHAVLLILITCYFVWPINLVYATGMWKDTFFAVVFLLTLSYCYAHIQDEHLKISSSITIGLLSFVSSLARNSGWSSLGVGAIFLTVYGIRGTYKKERDTILRIGIAQLAGVLIACFFIVIIYPLAGVTNTFSTIEKSIPLQQISRTVVDDELSPEEIDAINYFGQSDHMVDEIPDNYMPSLVDGVRGLFDGNTIKENSGKFNLLWLKLGVHHPAAYFHALIDHTAGYWWPDAGSWLADNRIFDNDYGVERSSKLFPGKDLAMALYRILTRILKLDLLSNSGFTFWMILFCIYICQIRHNKIGTLLTVPILMIYIGLIPVSYGSLFRYTYAAVLSMPMLIGYMFMEPSGISKEESGENKRTNWTEYYQRKKSFFSTYTQQFTLEKVLSCIDQSIGSEPVDSSIMELGGGNSCLAEEICNQRNISKYDFAFSIGLIEHFQPEERKQVIRNHFQYCRPGGFVMISFLTPTRKYLFWRRVMELLGMRMFWDEQPLAYDDVKGELLRNGEVLKVELNKKLFLTQMIIFAHKQEEGAI